MKKTLISTIAVTLALTGAMPALAALPRAPVDFSIDAEGAGSLPLELARRGRGADDAPGDDRKGRGRGTDDGPGHALGEEPGGEMIILARRGRGADDAPGDDRGRGSDDKGGKAKGGKNKTSSPSGSDNTVSGSGRKKPRIKGGSGCDDPGDVAEHAACR